MALATIPDVVRHAALTHGEGLATRCDGRSHTWRELALLVARLAGGLASAGVEAGVRVALLGQNTDHYLHLLFAVTALGSEIPLPLTPWAAVKARRKVENSMGAGESWFAPP